MLLLSNDDQIIVHVFAIFVLAFGSCAVSNFDLFHPLCWFPPFYALYSSAYAILYLVGYNTKYGYSKEGLVYSWIGLAVFLICISTKKVSIIISRHDNTGNSLNVVNNNGIGMEQIVVYRIETTSSRSHVAQSNMVYD